MRTLPLLLLLAGCESSEPITWFEGYGYGWTGFNHRISHLGFEVDGTDAVVAVVGGTSTTGVDPVLPDTCDPDSCAEFPVSDTADIDLRWVRVPAGKERRGRVVVDLVAAADGETTTAVVPLDAKARGRAFAVIGGFEIDTDHEAASGTSCYDPAYGWHPRRIAIALGAPVISDDGKAVEVDVTATFEAGLSLEADRACIDAIAADALVPMRVDVVVLAGDLAINTEEVTDAAAYGWGCEDVSGFCLEPDPQPDPDLAERPLGLDMDSAAGGWSRFDFRFHPADTQDRGAYLRTLSLAFDPDEGWASGHATNYSPITQLSGFDYSFTGEIRAVTLAEPPERGRVEGTVEATLDAEGILPRTGSPCRMQRMLALATPRILLLFALVGCSRPVDVSFRLPADGALIVTRTATQVTRTPFGPEGLEIKSTKRLDVLEGGRAGVDTLHWRESWLKYEIKFEATDGEVAWTMVPDAKGVVAPLPAFLVALGPHPPREVWVNADHTVLVRNLPWPEPEPPPDAKPKKPVVAPSGTPEVDPLAVPEPPPEPVQVSLEEVDNYFAGLVLAPTTPVKAGEAWSWTVSEHVTRGGDVSTTSIWTFDRIQGAEAVLVETLSLADAMAPAEGEFRTSALSGSGEMHLDLRTGLPTSYTSSYEADLASPSARGSSSMKVETKFRWKGPGE